MRTSTSTQSLRSQLIGAWELSECYAYFAHDQSNVVYPMGRDLKGCIIYTSDGYMSAQLATASSQRPSNGLDPGGPESDYLRRWGSYVAYTGPYYFDENGDDKRRPILLHHMQTCNVPFLVGETQRRLFQIIDEPDGQYLVLAVEAPMNVNGEQRMMTVRWRRLPVNAASSPPLPGDGS